jgi:hypothetical protein
MTALLDGRGKGGDAKGRSLRKAASNKGFVWSSRGGGVGAVRAKGLWDSMAGDKQGDPSLRRIVRSERKAAVYHLAGATTSKADPSPPFANDGRPDSG